MLKPVRHTADPVASIPLWVTQINNTFSKRRNEYEDHKRKHPEDVLTPIARKKVSELERDANAPVNWNWIDEEHLVVNIVPRDGELDRDQQVDLKKFTCSCGFPDINHMPCIHFARAVKHCAPDNKDLATYVPKEWTMERWKQQLDVIGTVQCGNLLGFEATADIYKPLASKRQRGRPPKRKREHSWLEKHFKDVRASSPAAPRDPPPARGRGRDGGRARARSRR